MNILISQQDTLIQYYTMATTDTLQSRVRNVNLFAQFAATLSYMSNLFSGWSVTEPGDPMVCKEVQVSLTDTALGTLRDMSKSHNSPILNRVAIPSIFTSTGMILSLQEQQQIVDHFGKKLNFFNFAMRDSFSTFIEERIGLLTIHTLTNTKTPSDYRGLFHIFPGGCVDIEYYRTKISNSE